MKLFTARRTPVLAAIAALSSVALLAGCSSQATPEGGSEAGAAKPVPAEFIPGTFDQAAADLLPAEIVSAGEVSVAAGPGYAPFYLFADDGTTLAGADIEVVRALGDVLGVEIAFADIKFDAMIPALQTNRVDMAAGGFSITPERLEVVDFVSNFAGGTSLIVPTGNPKDIDLDTMCGKTIAAQKGTIYADNYLPVFSDECEAAGDEPIEVAIFPMQPDATLAVSTGRADASMSDFGPLAYVADLSNGQLEVLQQNYDPSTWGFAFPQGSPLAPAVAAAMNSLIASGDYEEILDKWGVTDGAIDESTVHTNG